MNFRLALALVLGALFLIFIAQNYKVVEIRFLFWTLSMSRVVLLFGVFGVGTLVGWLLKSFISRSATERGRGQ
jgi:uncharacterized integral membrane protein